MAATKAAHSEDAEEDKLWSLVRANCLDFNAWTSLIQEIEKVSEDNIPKIRKVYDAFLAEFPLCFGYWKKYADHEGRWDSVDKVVEVYERAVHAVAYSVDMWLHYSKFAISTYKDPGTIRRIFERGLVFVRLDYRSYLLWDEYIRYEEACQAWVHVAMIYTRILENPLQQLDRYFNCFMELATSRPLSKVQSEDEAGYMATIMNIDSPCLKGELCPDDVEQSAKPAIVGSTEAVQLEKFISIREVLYKKSKEFESEIIAFERSIRRSYFHVRPLDDPELENWHNYLDFAEKELGINKVVNLYERCLIACANYPEFWIRYVLYLDCSVSVKLAYDALARATHVFVKKQPEIHLFAAKFKELCGDTDGARAEFEFLYSEISPCFLEAIVKHANMEYREGNKGAANSLYEKVIAAEKEKAYSKILPRLIVLYSRFLYLVAGNLEEAREVLFGSLDQVLLSKPLLEAIIHLETVRPQSKPIYYLDSLVEEFISPNSDNFDAASTADRKEISCLFIEFLDLFGDAQSIKVADDRHTKLFLPQNSSLISIKRQAEDYLAAEVLRASTDADSSSQSVVGAYPHAPSQCMTSYSKRAPWTQNPQAQGQQWNPAYAPQKQPEVHLFAAKFKELHGDIDGARAEFEFLNSELSPCLLEAIVKHANMEYRVGNKQAAISVYEKIINAEKKKEHSKILPMLLVHYSNFLYLVGDLERAREVLYGSLDQVQLSKPLLEAIIRLETIQPHSKSIDYLDSLVEKFILPNSDNSDVANTADREEISCIFMEFLDLFDDTQLIKDADYRHTKLFLSR